jgi:hypothetical protein
MVARSDVATSTKSAVSRRSAGSSARVANQRRTSRNECPGVVAAARMCWASSREDAGVK